MTHFPTCLVPTIARESQRIENLRTEGFRVPNVRITAFSVSTLGRLNVATGGVQGRRQSFQILIPALPSLSAHGKPSPLFPHLFKKKKLV